jgi:serine/threonine-protein phosphatase 2A regulatory subunit B''
MFVNRVFEEYQTYEGQMDYKAFLDFALAMENKKTP